MDLPATQAMGEDDLPATQQFVVNENNKKTLVGTLLINDKVYSIFSGITKIGRHPESQIFLNNETISKRHAEIEAESPEKTIFIRDLKSCNKTRINRSTLRPQSLYQIRDGDELIFGNVIAKFQLYRAIDDSLDSSCTAQDNQKTRVQIPDTPDSSMNTSSTSESDLSIIPGTQMDKTDSNFRLPKIPIRSSKSDEHRNPIIPTLGPLDLPSPLSKDKSRDDNISEVDTQRFSTKDDFENDSIYTIATQIPTNSSKAEDSENIYEMTTQRPADFDNDKDELENLETQRFDYRSSETIKCRILDSSNRKSLNVSIHSAETQKSNEYIENLETQQFDVRKSNFENEKLNDVSIYSAATQKNTCDESNSKSIKNLETQQLIDRKSNIANEKLNDVSIYSVATQKHTCNESDSKSIDNLETQQFDNTKLNVSNKKLCDVSIYSAVTQKITDNGSGESIENLETQKFDCQNSGTSRSKSRDTSIFNTSTQPNNYDKLNDSIENLETQPFDINKSNSVKGNSDDKSIHDTATQKNLNNDIGKSIENLETQPFDNKKSENLNNISESIEDVETQQFNLNDSKRLSKPKLVGREFSKSLYDAETQKCVSETIADTSFEEVETKQYMNKSIHNEFSTSITNPNIPNKSFCTAETEKYTTDKLDNKPINDLETQQYVNKTSNDEIDESTENMESLRLVDESPQMISSLSFTLQDMKTLPCTTKQKYTVCDDALQTNAKNTVESSSDSDIQKMEWESNQNNTSKHLHNSDSLKPSLSAQDIDTLIKNNEEVKSNVLDEEDDEIFSQNLIEDCPFAFLPEESVNEKESSTIQENIENKLNNSSISKISTNNINRTSKQINNKSHTIINESDSETDEEGVFSNCVSIKETNAKPSSKCDSKSKKSISTINETDSETDEDGEFSNHLSNNSECSIKKNEQDNNKNKEDSETDEEGIFSNNTINHDKSKNLSKIDKDIESDEDIFANVHEVSNTRSPGPNNSPSIRNSLNHEKSPTPDSQNAIFDDNHASNKDSIKKSEVPNDICTSHIIDQITTNTKSNQEIDDLAPTQGADGGSKAASAVTAAGSRMSSLQIIRSKRSGASDLDDAQNRPPKRSKTMPEDEERPKLQQLSQPDATTSVPRNKKRISKVPRTLDNFIVMHSPKTRTNSSDLSAVENSTDEDKQNEKSNRLRTRGKNAASKKNTKVEASIVHSNTSSKENLVVEDSDVECGPNTSNTQNVKSKTNEDISYLSLIGNSVKNETLNSDVENKNVVKTRARITRQKNSEKEAVVTKKIATVIQDSDTEESDESEFVKTKPKNNLSETDQLSNSGKSNISKNVNTKSQDKNINDSAISGKSSNIEVSVSTRMKSKRVQRIKESDKEKTDNSADTISKRNNTRKRRGSKSGDSNLEKSSDSENTVNSKTRNNQDKAVKESDSEKSDTTSNKVTRSKRIKKSDSDDSDRVVKKITNKQDGLKKQEPVIQRTRNRRAQDSASEQETVVVKNETRSRRAITRNQSSDSVFYESDNDKKTNLSLANTSSRSVRQTRKRTALTNVSTTDTPSSEESQEVAEIMSSFEENTNTRKTRRGRKVKDILSSSDTQDSESNCTNSEDVFEKPSSRPKRARLVKSTKNKSSTQNNLVDEEIKTYPSQPTSTQRITPNQEVLSTPSHSTSSRSRRTMSMSPMKGTSYKVLFTGERSEVHRKIVAKLGGSEMEDPAKCSILVTDKVRRTYKFLCCLARGIPIVSVNWLNDSGKAQRFLNWEDYILQDPIAEAKFEFKLKESLEKAVTHRLLEGYTVLLTPNITQPPISELKGMVISSGGKPLVKAPTKWPENTVIVTKEDDLISAKKIILKAPKSVTVHSTEFILTGILRQKLSLEIFKLTV